MSDTSEDGVTAADVAEWNRTLERTKDSAGRVIRRIVGSDTDGATPSAPVADAIRRARETLANAKATGENPTSQRALEDQLGELIDILTATPEPPAAPSVGAVAEGWKLVPLEPTEAMLEAGEEAAGSSYTGTPVLTPDDAYRAMLVAAPEPPAGVGESRKSPDAVRHAELPRPMDTAPRDATLVRLLVRYDHSDMGSHPMDDSAEPSWTVGHNTFDNTGDDEWVLAGWDWEQDCFTQSTGEPIGWLPFYPTPTAPNADAIRAKALEWYGERASTLASKLNGMAVGDALHGSAATVIEAILVELSLDAGKRAANAIRNLARSSS